jgi:hypothetical protein
MALACYFVIFRYLRVPHTTFPISYTYLLYIHFQAANFNFLTNSYRRCHMVCIVA